MVYLKQDALSEPMKRKLGTQKSAVPSIFVGWVVYLLVGVLYFFAHDYGVDFYKAHMGGFTARGVGIGATAELTFYFFIFINVIVFLVSNLAVKLVLLGAMVGVVLSYFLPENPVRAMAYSGLTSSMSLLALGSRLMADRLMSRTKNGAIPSISFMSDEQCRRNVLSRMKKEWSRILSNKK